MNKTKIKHDQILDDLEQRINSYNRYHKVMRNVEYKTDKYVGEVDLLTYDAKFDTWHFYEVKSNNRPARIFKAHQQYQRFTKAFPEYKVKGIFVSPNEVMRL